LTDADEALLALLQALAARNYAFVTPTPETHKRVLKRPRPAAPATLRDVFGWSRTFDAGDLPEPILEAMRRAEVLGRRGRRLISRVRVSSLGGTLFVHSAFPTTAADSVFLGPDSYRFADFITRELADGAPVEAILDVGAGAGVGGLVAARLRPDATVLLTDVNETAIRYARVNAALAGVPADHRLTSGLEGLEPGFDLIVANPPYIAGRSGPEGRTYRDGGDMLGAGLSIDWAEGAMDRLRPGGRLLLYTGSAIVDGRDRLRDALERRAAERGCSLRYGELDPDVFGEELSRPVYARAERIAVVGAVATKAG
jgi:methylase of polypeptide subunit release factors